MDRIDLEILQLYSSITCSGSGKIVYAKNASESAIEDVYDTFMDRLNDRAMENIISDLEKIDLDMDNVEIIDGEVKEEENHIVGSIIQKALIYALLHLSSNKITLINTVLANSTCDLEEEFREKTELAFDIFEEYLNYLIDFSLGIITPKVESSLFIKYPWLATIKESKGFITINDLARDCLEEMYITFVEAGASEEEIFALFDKYFMSREPDYMASKYAQALSSEKNFIERFKIYQARLILADAYLYLKTIDLAALEDTLSETEKLSLGLIEFKIDRKSFVLPADKEIRHGIYRIYINTICEDYFRKNGKFILQKRR